MIGDGNMYNFRTDLADERADIYRRANGLEDNIPGVETQKEECEEVIITRVKILDEQGEKAIGKPKGNYITLDIEGLRLADNDKIQKISECLQKELNKLLDMHIQKSEDILVVGLRQHILNTGLFRP